MEVPLVNESSFTPVNTASYSLDRFWLQSHHAIINNARVTRMPLPIDTLYDESTLTHQSLSRSLSTRRTVPPNPTASAVKQMHNSSSKRVKVLELKEEKLILNKEVDNTSIMSAKQNKKVTEPSKQDYIRVRARRGEATDSRSLAERARREKISERMKVLQDLVPGCNKVVGKALVLDEIINYVLSLQHQVEFLSMKLEAINSSVLPKDKKLPAKNLEVPGLDLVGLIFHAHPTSEYAQGPQSEGLPRHLRGTLERATH